VMVLVQANRFICVSVGCFVGVEIYFVGVGLAVMSCFVQIGAFYFLRLVTVCGDLGVCWQDFGLNIG
jgi:hypothetical protein